MVKKEVQAGTLMIFQKNKVLSETRVVKEEKEFHGEFGHGSQVNI